MANFFSVKNDKISINLRSETYTYQDALEEANQPQDLASRVLLQLWYCFEWIKVLVQSVQSATGEDFTGYSDHPAADPYLQFVELWSQIN